MYIDWQVHKASHRHCQAGITAFRLASTPAINTLPIRTRVGNHSQVRGTGRPMTCGQLSNITAFSTPRPLLPGATLAWKEEVKIRPQQFSVAKSPEP